MASLGLALFFIVLTPTPLSAFMGEIQGESLSLWWTLPFIGMLASLALMPLFAGRFWETHYGKIALGWSLITLLSLQMVFGFSVARIEVLGTFLHHYLPFVIMIGALYTISGGIRIDIKAQATPALNTALLALGTALAGWIGTTGASMLLVRPVLHINRDRKYRVHHMIFFIFLIANIGGALTPLGDPPLFLGFLNGITFFWPTEYLILGLIGITIPLLIIFYGLDHFLFKREGLSYNKSQIRLKIKGRPNGLLFLGVIGLVLLSGLWEPDKAINLFGISLEAQNIMRDGGLILLTLVSWFLTPAKIHQENHFSYEPLKEVAILFFGIFMTVIPVVAILDAGFEGALAPLISLVDVNGYPQNTMYFWLSGGLSSVLDNAPTYLVFFHMAGGNPELLMSFLSQTLEAISLGAVFMGALTYIGNAPNFMVKTIAESQKVPMPSFFGYMLWSLGILLPLLLLLSWWRF